MAEGERFTITFEDRFPKREVLILDQTVRVCVDCNTGWMSHLESEAKPLLLATADGWPTTLSPAQQVVLGRWLAKNCVLHEVVAGGAHAVSRLDQRHELASGGLPWQVVIGAFQGTGPNFAHRAGKVTEWTQERAGVDGRMTLHTVRFQCLVGQVVVHSLPEPPTISGLLGGSMFAIEIPSTKSVRWPPMASLSEDWLRAVSDTAEAAGEA